jgi:hypothetical protein
MKIINMRVNIKVLSMIINTKIRVNMIINMKVIIMIINMIKNNKINLNYTTLILYHHHQN